MRFWLKILSLTDILSLFHLWRMLCKTKFDWWKNRFLFLKMSLDITITVLHLWLSNWLTDALWAFGQTAIPCSKQNPEQTELLVFTCAICMLSITGLMLLVVLIGGVCQAHRRLLGWSRRHKDSGAILESWGDPRHTSIVRQTCTIAS